jgi:hypothetical protein
MIVMKKTFDTPLVKTLIGVIGASAVAVAVILLLPPYAPNPDPNHVHADFAVWIGGKQLDFSDPKYMSAPPKTAQNSIFDHFIPVASAHNGVDDEHEEETIPGREFLHLHDGNGYVIHRHKPGLTLGDFFASIGFSVASGKEGEWCWYQMKEGRPFDKCESGPMHLYVNGELYTHKDPLGGDNPLSYVFNDGDQLLLTDATEPREIKWELWNLTSQACKYSKTCPWKGTPPTESCIADPTVPCTLN